MNWIRIVLGMSVALSIIGCTSTRLARRGVNPWLQEWLLINVSGQNDQGFALQQNILLGIGTLITGEYLVTAFMTETGGQDQSFRFATGRGEVEIPSDPKKLAIQTAIDSSGQDFRFFLSNKFLWMDFPSGGDFKEGGRKLRLKIEGGKWKSGESKGVDGCKFWHASARAKAGDFQPKSLVEVSVLGIKSLDAVLALGDGGSVVWLNATKKEEILAGIFRYRDGKLTPLGGFGTAPDAFKGPIEVDSTFRSKVLPLDYPVVFGFEDNLLVSAKPHAQELPLGKRSFWMGRVLVYHEGSSGPASEGNMVIFRPSPTAR